MNTPAVLERPGEPLTEWMEELEAALGVPDEEILWELFQPRTYLLAPPPWPRGAFVIDPEAAAGRL